MICPACGTENIEGVDRCEECMTPFRQLDVPQPRNGFQAHIMLDPVRKVYSSCPATVSSRDPVARALEIMCLWNVGGLPVVDDGKLTGILTEADLLFKPDSPQIDLQHTKISELMTANPEVVHEDASISYALHVMSTGGYRHAPVMRGRAVVGMLSIKDIVHYLRQNLP